MKQLHHHLCKKSRVYHRWHQHPKHAHVHWGVLGSVVLGVALSFVILGWSEVEVANVQVARAASLAGVDGLTFADRKSAYLNSFQGQDDPANLTPTPNMTDQANTDILDTRVDVLFGWLEKCLTVPSWSGKCNSGNSGAVVEQTIRYFAGGSYWIHLGPKAQRGYAIIIPIKYKNVISTAAYNAVIDRYKINQVGQNDVYTVENENKLIMSAVGLYLYAEHFDPNATLTVYGCNTQCTKTWPSFTYNGVTYTNGMTGNFNALTLMKGFLINFIDEWMLANKGIRGQGEFDSLVYHRLFSEAMMLLGTHAKDTGMKNRGKMAGDLMVLDGLMDFSANSWGGTLGRTDYKHMGRTPRYPLRVLFGLSSNETEWDIPAVYSIGYTPPDVLVALSRFDETWRFHKEYNQELHTAGKGKWNYLTANYNIGSDVGPKNDGWQVNVKGSGAEQFIRLFINEDSVTPRCLQEGNYMGATGSQLKNALFADVGSPPHLWEFKNGVDWQRDEADGIWRFKQLGTTYVAIGGACVPTSSTSCSDTQTTPVSWGCPAGANGVSASVEVAEEGVDYATFDAFKAAVKANAFLSNSQYRTSRGQPISASTPCGLTSVGDCVFPFDRMETESSVGKLIDWQMTPNGPLMVVKKGTLTCNYAFGSWTYNGNGCGASSGGTTNQPPSNLVLRYLGPTPTGGNLCGNGTINTGEQCDGSNLNNQTCQSLGFTGGTPACYPAGSANQCTFNTSGCTGGTTCNNNGIKEGTERCDGTQLGGATCPAGTTGTPTCSNCTLSYSACTPIGGTGSWNHTYPRLAYQHFRDSPPDWNALFDLVVITRPVAETAVTAKAINPNTKFIFTRSITAYGANQKQKRVIDCPDWTDQWYVLRSDGSQALTQGRNQPLLDLTNLAPLNSKGERYNQHIPKCFDTWMREVGFDGAGTDWMWISPTEVTGNIDFNRNGQNDYNEAGKGTAWVNQTWLTGLQTLLNNWRADLGVNPPLWLNSGGLHDDSSIPPLPAIGFEGVLKESNGLEFERQQGHRSFSREWGQYQTWINGGRKPTVWITDTYPDAGDTSWSQKRGGNTKNYYELMRMMLAFTMLGDGYFQYNPREGGEHHFYDYYDEFDLKRSMPGYPKGLLGDPLGAAVQVPGTSAWARFFQGGVAIENPTSGSVTVTSAQLAAVDPSPNKTYYRFRGNQDPTFNNGQQFTSVTLTGHSVGAYSVGDGIILVRESNLNNRTVIADIIVDNVDDFTSPGSVSATFTGAWADPPTKGVNAILTNWSAWTHDNDTGRGTYAFRYLKGAIGNAFYRPTINVPGQYEVFEWHSDLSMTGVDIDGPTGESSPGTADTAVNHTITHAGGTAVRDVNQALNPGRWNSLGTYQFTGASSQGVRILGDGSSNVIQADAIKFVYRGP